MGLRHMTALFTTVLSVTLWIVPAIESASVVPPPWADPKRNPCAKRPGATWQMLHWPADDGCYQIYKIGFPCPETQELQAEVIGNPSTGELRAVCKCPPGTALHRPPDTRCYKIHESGPCSSEQYFAPNGKCKLIGHCPDPETQAWWPIDQRCYKIMTRGPCSKGKLVDRSSLNPRLVECKCSSIKHRWLGGAGTAPGCYEHGTKGPCLEEGHIFLENAKCGCNSSLPHFDPKTEKCWEIGSRGPCQRGQTWHGKENGGCQCQNGLTLWPADGRCYRPYTRGPCALGRALNENGNICTPAPCAKRGELYVPGEGCFKPGQRGPCPPGSVVAFDLRARPSLDGPSYRGVCTPSSTKPPLIIRKGREHEICPVGHANFKNRCHPLYSRGPCPINQWLVPNNKDQSNYSDAICDCRPPYTRTDLNSIQCLPPVVNLVNYLNKHFVTEVKS